nr:hypothetical protein [Chthoniobacter flavus]
MMAPFAVVLGDLLDGEIEVFIAGGGDFAVFLGFAFRGHRGAKLYVPRGGEKQNLWSFVQ